MLKALILPLIALLMSWSGTSLAADLRVSRSAPDAYRTVQAAIDALPTEGGTIRIDSGEWREKLTVGKGGVTLVGSGPTPAATVLVWGDSSLSAGGTFKSATATVIADDFHAANLTIRNDWWTDPAHQPSQAVALAITGDRAVLWKVRLHGHQDTLFAGKGSGGRMARQWFSDCYIEGHVDFIFGNAKAMFDRCHIHGVAGETVMITAQSRNSPDEDSAYVFSRCRITADEAAGAIWLGRSWRDYARVMFLDTRMDANVAPAGWREWTPGTTNRLPLSDYAEYRSSGRGASPATRAPTSRQLTAKQVRQFRPEAFYHGDTAWIAAGMKHLRTLVEKQ